MSELVEKIKDFAKVFGVRKNIAIVVVLLGIFVVAEVLAYFAIFRWNVSLVGEAPRNYFAVVTIAVGYGLLVLIPQTIAEIYRKNRLIIKLKCTVGKYKEIAQKYHTDCPKYGELSMALSTKSTKNPISGLVSWAYMISFLFSFFALLRVSEVDDIVAVFVLIMTALLWGIMWSVTARQISNRMVSKAFWSNVNLAELTGEDTDYMQRLYATRTKKAANNLLVFCVCETTLMVMMTLALQEVIAAKTLIIVSACVVGVGLGLVVYFSLKKYHIAQEKDEFVYTFKD